MGKLNNMKQRSIKKEISEFNEFIQELEGYRREITDITMVNHFYNKSIKRNKYYDKDTGEYAYPSFKVFLEFFIEIIKFLASKSKKKSDLHSIDNSIQLQIFGYLYYYRLNMKSFKFYKNLLLNLDFIIDEAVPAKQADIYRETLLTLFYYAFRARREEE